LGGCDKLWIAYRIGVGWRNRAEHAAFRTLLW
jgi:hypothetical protein